MNVQKITKSVNKYTNITINSPTSVKKSTEREKVQVKQQSKGEGKTLSSVNKVLSSLVLYFLVYSKGLKELIVAVL